MKNEVIYFSFFILVYGCSKDISTSSDQSPVTPQPTAGYDTITPLSYFPAYPGSWWIYESGDTLKCAPNYVPHSIYYQMQNSWSDTLYVPEITPGTLINNVTSPVGHIYGYTAHEHWWKRPLVQFVMDSAVGARFSTSWHPQSGSMKEGIILSRDTTIILSNNLVFDSVIVIHEMEMYAANSPYYHSLYLGKREYYAKNVGLIKREQRDFPDSSLKVPLELSSYHINH